MVYNDMKKNLIEDNLFIIFVQLYSDNSKTLMNLVGLTFYPLDIKGMNFSKIVQHLLSIDRHTILTYVYVEFSIQKIPVH